MSDKPPAFEYVEDGPPPRSRSNAMLWVVMGACALVAVGMILFIGRSRNAQMGEAQLAEAENIRAMTEAKNAGRARMAHAQARSAPEALTAPEVATDPFPVPPGYMQALARRLVGSELEGDGRWSFAVDHFVLAESNGRPLPDDLLTALLGPNRRAHRIEGRWRIEDNDWMIVFTDIRGDGKEGRPQARLTLAPADRVRLNLGNHPYNIAQ